MTNSDRLRRQLRKIYILTNLQRAARLSLRAIWLGAAGIMLGWGVNALWGRLPNPLSWLLIGLVFALVPCAGFLTFFTAPSKWIRSMDQSLGLRGQLSTALETARRKAQRHKALEAGETEPAGTIEDLLIADALDILPQVRKRALRPGLFHEIDLAAVMILTVLACVLLASLLIRPQPDTKSSTSSPIIPLTALTSTPDQAQATADPKQSEGQQQPAGQSGQSGAGSQGQQGQAGNDPGGSGSASRGDQSQGNPANQDMNALSDALHQMGSQLSKQAGTYSLGQSLENMDLNGAAKALEDLGKQLNNLSPESQNNLAQSMQNAANALSQTGAGTSSQALSNDLGSAASALSGANQDANGALGQVANDLRQLAQGMQASGGMQSSRGNGSSAGNGNSSETGNPEPLSRLPNENGDFSIPVDGSAQSGLLSPGQPDSTGTDTAAGSLDSTYQAGGNVSQAPILPNTFSWKWRNVVSQYFQR